MTSRTSRRQSLRILGLALGLSLAVAGCGESCSCENVPQAEAVTIYVVRHAEKEAVAKDAPEEARRDPPLSKAGELRAIALAEDISIKDIDAIYVTRTKRSEQTAAAVAALTGVKPTFYPPKDYAELTKRLRARPGSHVLLVGHSNTIPPLLAALGVSEEVTIDEGQYGDLWVVRAQDGGKASLEVRRFGDAVDAYQPDE